MLKVNEILLIIGLIASAAIVMPVLVSGGGKSDQGKSASKSESKKDGKENEPDFKLMALVAGGAIIACGLFYLLVSVSRDFLARPHHAESHRPVHSSVAYMPGTRATEKKIIVSEAEVQQIETEEHDPVVAPLALGGTDTDPWSPWIQIPTAGVHGFDALVGPTPQTGLVRMQCSSGSTAEAADANPHESFPCGPHSWFRVNTVQTAKQTVPLSVRYMFLHNS